MSTARIAAFKSKTLALIDTLHFTPDEVVGLGLTLAVAHALPAGIGAAALHAALDQSFDAATCAAASTDAVVGK